MTEKESIAATSQHAGRVRTLLAQFGVSLGKRGLVHDLSKTEDPELAGFTAATPKLAGLSYTSEEYEKSRVGLGKALEHHYEANSHHPEHFGEQGILGMSLVDVVEMLFDWKAATERHDDGDIISSIIYNVKRFKLGEQLGNIFLNTAFDLWPNACKIDSPGGPKEVCTYCGRKGHWRPDCPYYAVKIAALAVKMEEEEARIA